MDFELFLKYIEPNLMVVIPTLWGIGFAIKQSKLSNKLIPIILMVCSCLFCGLYLSSTRQIFDFQCFMSFLFASITQGCIIWLVSWISYEKFLHDKNTTLQ